MTLRHRKAQFHMKKQQWWKKKNPRSEPLIRGSKVETFSCSCWIYGTRDRNGEDSKYIFIQNSVLSGLNDFLNVQWLLFFWMLARGNDLAPGEIDCMFFKTLVYYDIFEQQFSQIPKVFLAATCETCKRLANHLSSSCTVSMLQIQYNLKTCLEWSVCVSVCVWESVCMPVHMC